MSYSLLKKMCCITLFSATLLLPTLAYSGGIVVGGTRVIYPAESKQTSISIKNTSEKSSFLVQSWVEDGNGKKSTDFIVTPPLYVSGPANENTLRIISVGSAFAKQKETLFYFNAKAVPSIDKDKVEGKNILLMSAVTRIKLLVRPKGLDMSVEEAPSKLVFTRSGHELTIKNPTPYYITLARLEIGGVVQEDKMVPPGETIFQKLKVGSGNLVTYQTINDYGSLTPTVRTSMHYSSVIN